MSWLRLMEENLKANEGEEAEIPAEATPDRKLPKKNKVATLIREMWPAYLIEVFVIILGITVTLAMEKWRDNSKEEELEQIYLKNLMTDVVVDRSSLDYATKKTEKLLENGNELLSHVKEGAAKDLSATRINADLDAILDRPNFRSSDATFSDLKNSGNLHLLKDIPLKNTLFAYYGEAQHIKELQDAELLATINISGPYFVKRFSLGDSVPTGTASVSNSHDTLPKDVEFKNNVLLRVRNRQELLVQYQQASALSGRLMSALLGKIR